MQRALFYACLAVELFCLNQAQAQQRKVLIEQFTNSGCPPCAQNTPVVASYVNSNMDVLMLSYHTAFPYFDSMYHENAMQSDQRVAYYSIGAVPLSVVDGNYFTGNLVPVISNTIMTRATSVPRYSVTINNAQLSNNGLTAEINFESTDAGNANENLVAHLVVAEEKVLKSSYICCAGANLETEYPWVVRKMLPDANGTTLVNKYLGGTDIVYANWNLSHIKDISELRIIAFVQNNTSREVYQSEIAVPVITTSINDVKLNSIHVVNPVINNNITFYSNENRNARLSITEISGRIVHESFQNIKSGNNQLTIEVSKGIYLFSIDGTNEKITQKIIIL